MEDATFGWNHSQAGAWIARRWDLPDELVCAIGFHHASEQELVQHGLTNSAVSAVALASRFESAQHPTEEEMADVQEVMDRLYQVGAHQSMGLLLESAKEFDTVADAFGITATSKGHV